MNFTFLLAGFGFVAIAGVLYYFTSKTEELEEAPAKKTNEAPKPVVPVYEVFWLINVSASNFSFTIKLISVNCGYVFLIILILSFLKYCTMNYCRFFLFN